MPKMFLSLSPVARAYLIIHFCVVLWGFTPIMGRLISIDAVSLVWWRMLFAAAILLLFPATWRGFRRLNKKLFAITLIVGFMLAITWVLFYLSVKMTNASVGAICLAATPLFISLFGPWVSQRSYSRSDVLLALVMIPAMVLVAGGIPADMLLGFFIGLLAALVLGIFSGLNKLIADKIYPLSAAAIVMAAGAFLVAMLILLLPNHESSFAFPDLRDFTLLMTLASLMTAVPMALLLVALRHISVFAQQTAVNLEPIYAILLAIPILGEAQELSLAFYLGALIIVGSVLLEPLLARRTVNALEARSKS